MILFHLFLFVFFVSVVTCSSDLNTKSENENNDTVESSQESMEVTNGNGNYDVVPQINEHVNDADQIAEDVPSKEELSTVTVNSKMTPMGGVPVTERMKFKAGCAPNIPCGTTVASDDNVAPSNGNETPKHGCITASLTLLIGSSFIFT